MRAAACTVAAIAALASPSFAEDFSDPSWPCVQRKVPRLSAGLMWPEPPAPGEIAAPARADAEALVDRLALRRIPQDELPALVASFTARHGDDELGRIFAEVFENLDRTRSRVIEGIETYSLQQVALSERIDAARAEFARIEAAEEPDFDRLDALEEQIDWDQRIHTDRQRSLTYVCETPVLIEKRLYAIAQILSDAAEG